MATPAVKPCMCGHAASEHRGEGWGGETYCLHAIAGEDADDVMFGEYDTVWCRCVKYVPRGTMLP